MVLLQNGAPAYPAAANDSGTGVDGTAIDAAFLQQIRDAIDGLIHSTTNPTVTPKAVIDEVVTARGTTASLNARLANIVDAAGVPTINASVGAINLAGNGEFIVWSAGDAAAPDYFVLAGAGAAIARAGTGLGDANTKIGDFCAKVTAAPSATLTQTLLDNTAFAKVFALRARKVSVGCWVKSAVQNQARITIQDGFSNGFSSYHTGDGTWQWLSATLLINSFFSVSLSVAFAVDVAGSAYVSGLTVVLGDTAPRDWMPSQAIYRQERIFISGVQTVANSKVPSEIWFDRSCIVKEIALRTQTLAPTGADLIVRPNHWDGAAMQELFTAGGRPRIVAGAGWGSALPDGTYRYRCFRGGNVTTNGITDALFSLDITQIGSVQAGTDLHVLVRLLEYLRPFEAILASGNFS